MRAAVYRGPNNLRIETVPVPRIGPNELLVKVAVCGVCPTDIKKIQFGTVPPPRIFGHETAGTIVRMGARVRGFKIGERVALHHHVPCLDCHACRHHAFAQCQQYKRTGITAGFEPAGGGFAEYVRVMPFVLPGVVKILARNGFEEGAMLEPVNTVLKAVKRLSLLPGDAVLVAGQGPIGLMFTRLLQLRGMKVLATDLMKERLQLARQFGARWAVAPSELGTQIPMGSARGPRAESGGPPDSFSTPTLINTDTAFEQIAAGNIKSESDDDFGGPPKSTRQRRVLPVRTLNPQPSTLNSFDAAILAVPSDAALRQAMQLVRGAGQILLFAHTKRGALTEVDLASVCVDEKDLIGSYSADFTLQREVARLVFARRLDVRSLITHRFPLEQTAAAVELASHPTPESLKVVVELPFVSAVTRQ